MTTTVEALAGTRTVILVVHTGDVAAADMRQAGRRIVELADPGAEVLVLTDFSAATSLPGAIDMLAMLEQVQRSGVTFRQAMVWPADDAARLALDVWRTAEGNRGLDAQVFGDRAAALAWLES